VFGDGQRDARDIHFLKGIKTNQAAADLPSDAHHGR
jgi:hypothetical protein